MFDKNYLHFNRSVSKNKPNSFIENNFSCPFCDLKNKEDIIDQDGDVILIRNIYNVFDNAFQTVLIEDSTCEYDFSTYTKEKRDHILNFGFRKWEEMKNSGNYKSVIFYKNQGVISGGSLVHPHMQIIGLYEMDYMENILPEHFNGILIDKSDTTEFNLSIKPISGAVEFNIISDKYHIEEIGKYIQIATHYILNTLNVTAKSYNMFFYELNGKTQVKIISRTITAPFTIGYKIPIVSVNIQEIADYVKKEYF